MRSINEKCAVIAATNIKDFDVARLVYLGLWSLQHRGQDSSGIASYDGVKLHVHKKSGLVSQVYNEVSLSRLKGRSAIGHNRYSTSGGVDVSLAQPFSDESINFAFAHNGNLPYTEKLKAYLLENQLTYQGLNDSGLMAMAISRELKKTESIKQSIKNCWPLFTGAFCCVGLYNNQVFAFRDEYGIRPLSIGKTDHGYIVASETVGLDIIGAKFVRDVQPGELIVLSNDKLDSIQIKKGREQIDAFEFVYLARPDSRIGGQSVYSARYRAGRALAKVLPVKADLVLGVPDSGIPSATGYAYEAGIRSEYGLLKNRYIGRTFIEPEKIRKSSVELKFNVIVEVVANKDIILVDDSLVRGNTLKYVVRILKEYGAKSIHIRIASPPVKYPDFYGIDMPAIDELIANKYNQKETVHMLNADSIAYLPMDDFVRSIGLPKQRLCLSSFNGIYPIEVPYGKA